MKKKLRVIAVVIPATLICILYLFFQRNEAVPQKQPEAGFKEVTVKPTSTSEIARSAENEWLGGDDPGSKAIPEGSLLSNKTIVNHAKVWTVNLKAQEIVTNLFWSDDSQYLYLLQKEGTLRKLSMPFFIPVADLSVDGVCARLENSSEGMVIVVGGGREAWIVEKESLTLKRKIDTRGDTNLTTSTASPIAYSSNYRGEFLAIFDLARGEYSNGFNVSTFAAAHGALRHEQAADLEDCNNPRLTPDGNYLFCISGGSLHRFKTDGFSLFHEESGAPVCSRIQISPDSRYIAALSERRITEIKDHANLDPGIYIYDVDNLQKPVLAITQETEFIGFDRASQRLYVQNYANRSLIVLNSDGTLNKEYALGINPRQILVHPEGDKMLILDHNRLLWVELP